MADVLALDPSGGLPDGSEPGNPERRTWLLASAVVGGAGVCAAAVPFVASLAPSDRARAMGAAVEVDIGDLAPGALMTVAWRGQPVWILRRTPEELALLGRHDTQLVDPDSKQDQQPPYAANPQRSIKPEYLVLVGICTHLGCSPTKVDAGSGNPGVPADWPGGFLCPCHGSTFDFAGRVYKDKPAPSNLVVPPYRYLSDTRLRIGDDTAS